MNRQVGKFSAAWAQKDCKCIYEIRSHTKDEQSGKIDVEKVFEHSHDNKEDLARAAVRCRKGFEPSSESTPGSAGVVKVKRTNTYNSKQNQDSYSLLHFTKRETPDRLEADMRIFVVADGHGPHGEIFSELCAFALPEIVADHLTYKSEDSRTSLTDVTPKKRKGSMAALFHVRRFILQNLIFILTRHHCFISLNRESVFV